MYIINKIIADNNIKYTNLFGESQLAAVVYFRSS